MRPVAGGASGARETSADSEAFRPGEAFAEAGRGPRGNSKSAGSLTLLALLVGVALVLTARLTGPSMVPDGQAAHGFSLPPLLNSKTPISLSQYAGKPLILNFCSAWSPPCQDETRLLAKFYRLRPGLKVIGIDSWDNRAAALRMLHAGQVGYPVANDPTESVGRRYGVPGIPTTYFLNSQHVIIETNLGWLNWKKLKDGMKAMDANDIQAAG